MKIFLIICAIAISAGVVYGMARTQHPYLTAVKSAVSGVGALLLINTVSGSTGCYIPINSATVFMSTVLSLPGVLALLVMKIIFNY